MTKNENMSSEAAVPPPAVWAQRSDVVFLTLNVECTDPEFKFTDTTMSFSGVGKPEGRKYALNFEFYDKINPETVSAKNIKRCIEFVIAKAEPDETYWPRLLKEKTKAHWLKVDFNKWEDEDPQGDAPMRSEPTMDLTEMLRRNTDTLDKMKSNKLSLNDSDDESEKEDSDNEDVPGLID
ncbi:uncharacterized protein CG16817-like [Anopheles nili]|uniref:uncharacterized protein CG16817-like n=1 Tax=Anopheles nili TaxID=185578 RepID=UPI00237A8BD4|nr:uncharacterized protein CG16817-like [Anopheles nili]